MERTGGRGRQIPEAQKERKNQIDYESRKNKKNCCQFLYLRRTPLMLIKRAQNR